MSLGWAGGPAPGQGTWAAQAQTGSLHPRWGGRGAPDLDEASGTASQMVRLSEIATGSGDIQLAWAG